MDWISYTLTSLSSTALTAILCWIFKNWIAVRLTASVKHEFDLKIEKSKSEFRNKEEELKSELKSNESQIEILQSTLLNQLSARQITVCNKQFESIEILWDSVIKMHPQKTAAKIMQSVKFDFALDQAPTDSKIREMFSGLIKTFNLKVNENKSTSVSRARLYVSSLTWSLYQAYSTVIWFAVTKMMMIEQGQNTLNLFKTQEIIDLVKEALPHQAKFIDEKGISSLDFLVEELESKLFTSLKSEIQGIEEDMYNAQRATAIINKVNSIQEKAVPSTKGPTTA
ncbi:hypothetical protein JCM14469_43370 [Desulfatiferula olefinivorans]